mgnify:CR=1 FL=1
MINNNDLFEKYKQLDPYHRKMISEFIDFLLSQRSPSKDEKKRLLLDTSVWNEKDIQSLTEVQKDLMTWKAPMNF